jgi:tRNA uridine 5-carbamoylmethylation protein Kti12
MFKDHYKIAIVFNYNKQEILERNESRKNKKIPIEVIDSMINKYDTPTLEEGFDLIVKF